LDDVDWIVEGTHPLAGHYHSKAEFLEHTFENMEKVLPRGAELYVEHVLVSGDWAVVELIVEVRAYLDCALVARLFEENPI
jgi:ketosteroid isomerase-like protein